MISNIQAVSIYQNFRQENPDLVGKIYSEMDGIVKPLPHNGKPITLYHGTTLGAARKISQEGFKTSLEAASGAGEFGDAVYLTPSAKQLTFLVGK